MIIFPSNSHLLCSTTSMALKGSKHVNVSFSAHIYKNLSKVNIGDVKFMSTPSSLIIKLSSIGVICPRPNY